MLRTLQRPIALALLPIFLLHSVACTSVQKVPSVEAEPPTKDHLVGVTTLAGTDIKFDGDGAIVGDTVQGTVKKAPVRVPVDSVQRWWLKRTNAGKSALAVLGVAAGVVGVLIIIAAATKESCPFVYSWDGTRYVFDTEPYGGAITRGLERDDYGELPNLRREGGSYRLLVTNEVNETQMTNLFELWVVDHAPGLRVLPDEWGRLHTLSDPQPPRRATDQTGQDLLSWLSADDRRIWEPLPVADSDGGLQDRIVMTFPRPAGASQAKLVSRVGTALWGSHMIRSTLELRGTAVDDWYRRIDTTPAAADSVRRWAVREQLYGLPLEVEEEDGWHVRGVLSGSGPFLAAERVLPVDLSRVRGDSVRLRISPPRGFWALGYFAMDYSADHPLSVDTVPPRSASGDSTILAAIAAADTQYYAMPNTGDRTTVEFTAPPRQDRRERTVILHSRGWYRLHLTASAEPDTAMLQRIAEVPGATVEYSAGLYRKWVMAIGRSR
jgi:hypothetical protein